MAYGSVNADLMTTSDGVSSSGLYGFKNRLINSAMVIDQRNAGSAITVAGFTVDRWYNYVSASSKASVGRSTTAPDGFAYSLGVTSSSAYSVTASDYFMLYQGIEGFNFYDMGWGTANAKTVTLSFWVRSSLTGTFGGSMQNWNQDRSYPFTYTVNSANTWEQKSITIAGDTSGTWVGASNAGSAEINFSYGMGSTKSGTAGAWAGANYLSATGATSVVGTNGATFYITGVQLEKGSTATSFDYRPYPTELAMCQRYYEKSYNQSQVPGSTSSVLAMRTAVVGFSGSEFGNVVTFKVSKRTNPTMTFYTNTSGASGTWVALPAAVDRTVTASEIGENSFSIVCSGTSTDGSLQGTFTASAEL